MREHRQVMLNPDNPSLREQSGRADRMYGHGGS